MRKYIIFYNYIYIKCCKSNVLLYNTLDDNYMMIDDPVIVRAVSKVHANSYYGFEISKSFINDQSFVSFLENIRDQMFGEVVEKDKKFLPLVFQPVVDVKSYSLDDDEICMKSNHIQRDIDYFRNRMGSDIIDNLYEVTLHINSTPTIHKYKFAYRQYFFPSCSTSKMIDLEWVKREFALSFPNLEVLNLIIGELNTTNFFELTDFILFLSKYYKLNIYLLARDFCEWSTYFVKKRGIQYVLWILREEELLYSYPDYVIKYILAENKKEYLHYTKISKTISGGIFVFPYYNKLNKEFCSELLSYSIKDLKFLKLRHNKIVANSILNTNKLRH